MLDFVLQKACTKLMRNERSNSKEFISIFIVTDPAVASNFLTVKSDNFKLHVFYNKSIVYFKNYLFSGRF